jgi:uncharacterized membrane protein YfhO
VTNAHIKSRTAKWLLIYTFWFALVAAGLYAIFVLDGKTVIWADDGLMQVYNTLAYVSDHVRSLFSGHIAFDMVDLHLGQGMDALACMSFYGLTDPLNLLAALATGDGLEAMYALLMGLRLYLAGAAFGLYARYALGSGNRATAVSALMYVFSGYMLFAVVRHPHFVNGALYLPLILYGAEKLLRERRSHAFVGFTALMLIANFFFAYINTLLAILYVLIRLAFRLRASSVRAVAADGFRLVGSYLLGLALSCVVLLPIAHSYLQNGRIDNHSGYLASLLYYPAQYYVKLLEGFTQPVGAADYWIFVGFTPISVFCVALLFLKRDKSRRDAQILVGLGALAFCALFPFIGKVFNAMGYVTNRWSYAFALPICLAGARMLPELVAIEKKRLNGLIAFMLAYHFIGIILALIFSSLIYFIPGIIATLLCLIALCALRGSNMGQKTALTLLCASLIFAYAFSFYSPYVADYAKEFNDAGVYERMLREDAAAAAAIDDEGVFRATSPNITDAFSAQLNYMGVSYYWSIVPGWTAQYQADIMLSTRQSFHKLYGLDARTSLCALAGLKYLVRHKGSDALLPYGCAKVGETETADIFENPYALPLGYAYPRAISESALYDLSPLDRQQAYAAFAVCEGSDLGSAGECESAVTELSCSARAGEGIVLTDSRIVTGKGGTLYVDFEAPANGEVYVLIDGVCMTPVGSDPKSVRVTSATDAGQGRNYITCLENGISYEQQGLLANLGCSAAPMTGCALSFDAGCTIEYDSIHVYYLPIKAVTDALEALAKRPLTNVQASENRISGEIALDAPAVLQISVPYSDGWTAHVDGKRADLFRCGGMYMGIDLEAGVHSIVLTYRTPYLAQGAIVSCAALLIWIALILYSRRHAKGLCA